jgi:hypothetical protein
VKRRRLTREAGLSPEGGRSHKRDADKARDEKREAQQAMKKVVK